MGGKPQRKPLARAAQLGLQRRGFCANRATHTQRPGSNIFLRFRMRPKGRCAIRTRTQSTQHSTTDSPVQRGVAAVATVSVTGPADCSHSWRRGSLFA